MRLEISDAVESLASFAPSYSLYWTTKTSRSYTISDWGPGWFWSKKGSRSCGGSSKATGRSSEDEEAEGLFGWEEYMAMMALDVFEAPSTCVSFAAHRWD